MWLAAVLHRPELGMVTYHEPSHPIARPLIEGEPWLCEASANTPAQQLSCSVRSTRGFSKMTTTSPPHSRRGAAPCRPERLPGCGLWQYSSLMPKPPPERIERLQTLLPGVEVVRMYPSWIPQPELDALLHAEPLGVQRCVIKPQDQRSPSAAPSAPALVFGPLRRGTTCAGWLLRGLRPERDGLHMSLTGASETTLELVLQADQGGHHRPFPVAEGGIYYRQTPFEFGAFEPLCRMLADLVRRALGRHTLQQALDAWSGQTGERAR